MPKDDDTFYEVQLDNRQLVYVFLGALAVCLLFFVLGFWVGRSDGRSEAESLAGRSEVAPLLDEASEGLPPFEEVSEESLPSGDFVDADRGEEQESGDGGDSRTNRADLDEPSSSGGREKRDTPEEETITALGQPSDALGAPEPADAGVMEPPSTEKKGKKDGPNLVNVNKGTPGQWAVQVAAFSDIMQAMEMKRRLERDGFTAYMEPLRGKDNKVLKYRVRIGKYASAEEAKAAQATLKDKKYGDTWLIDTTEKE